MVLSFFGSVSRVGIRAYPFWLYLCLFFFLDFCLEGVLYMYDTKQQLRLDRLARRWREGRGDRDQIYDEVRHIVADTPGKYSYQLFLCRSNRHGRSYRLVDEVRSRMDEAIWRALECWKPGGSPFNRYVDYRVEQAARKFWWASGGELEMPVHISGQVWQRYQRAVVQRANGKEFDEELVGEVERFRSWVPLDAARGDDGNATLIDMLRSTDCCDEMVVVLRDVWSRCPALTDDDVDILLALLDDRSYEDIAMLRGRGETRDDIRERWLVVLDILAAEMASQKKKTGGGGIRST